MGLLCFLFRGKCYYIDGWFNDLEFNLWSLCGQSTLDWHRACRVADLVTAVQEGSTRAMFLGMMESREKNTLTKIWVAKGRGATSRLCINRCVLKSVEWHMI